MLLFTTIFLTSLPVFSEDKKLSIKMNNVEYLNRWSKETLFEFTPKGQEDLKTWTDMISIIPFNAVKKSDFNTEFKWADADYFKTYNILSKSFLQINPTPQEQR